MISGSTAVPVIASLTASISTRGEFPDETVSHFLTKLEMFSRPKGATAGGAESILSMACQLLAISRSELSQNCVRGKAMNDEPTNLATPRILSFECDCCGQFFESWDRLRQHQIDCGSEIDDSAI